MVDIDDAEAEVRKQMRNLNQKRARLAAEAAQQQPQQTQAPVASTSVAVQEPADQAQPNGQETKPSLKRPAEDGVDGEDPEGPDSKRPKTVHQPPANLKRDRENATVLVGGFAPNATEEDLRNTFKDVRGPIRTFQLSNSSTAQCGIIREVVLFVKPDQPYATIEFVDRVHRLLSTN